MMGDKRRIYTAEFTRAAVHLVTEPGDAVAEAARNLGLNPPRLQRWKRELPVQKSSGLFCQRVEVRYACILQHQDTWPLAVLCEGLNVSRSGLYA
jgi:transposase-like protein